MSYIIHNNQLQVMKLIRNMTDEQKQVLKTLTQKQIDKIKLLKAK